MSAPAGAVALVLPPMDDDLAEILGRVCFQCISIAQLLRVNGHTIANKAEAEQAAVIYWLLSLYAKHGAEWRKAAGEEMDRLIGLASEKADAKATDEKGAAA